MEVFINWYSILLFLCFLLGSFFFLQLPKENRKKKFYWLPFLILAITFFYENLANYTVFDPEFNTRVNALLGNTENPRYNVWVYNLFNQYVAGVLYLFLIQSWLPPGRRRVMAWIIGAYIILSWALLFTGVESLYLNQPITFSIEANLILISCGLYFITLITDDNYIRANPLKLISFWQVTFFLFTYSLTYINWVSASYLYDVNRELGISLTYIDMIMGIINLLVLSMIILSPRLPQIFQKEPYYKE